MNFKKQRTARFLALASFALLMTSQAAEACYSHHRCFKLNMSMRQFVRACKYSGGSVSATATGFRCSSYNGRIVVCDGSLYSGQSPINCYYGQRQPPKQFEGNNGGKTGYGGEGSQGGGSGGSVNPNGGRPPSAGGAGEGVGSVAGNTGNGGID